jgi:hypothetical protein
MIQFSWSAGVGRTPATPGERLDNALSCHIAAAPRPVDNLTVPPNNSFSNESEAS